MKYVNVLFILAILFLCTTSLNMEKLHNHKHKTQSHIQAGSDLSHTSTSSLGITTSNTSNPINRSKLSVYPRSV